MKVYIRCWDVKIDLLKVDNRFCRFDWPNNRRFFDIWSLKFFGYVLNKWLCKDTSSRSGQLRRCRASFWNLSEASLECATTTVHSFFLQRSFSVENFTNYITDDVIIVQKLSLKYWSVYCYNGCEMCVFGLLLFWRYCLDYKKKEITWKERSISNCMTGSWIYAWGGYIAWLSSYNDLIIS